MELQKLMNIVFRMLFVSFLTVSLASLSSLFSFDVHAQETQTDQTEEAEEQEQEQTEVDLLESEHSEAKETELKEVTPTQTQTEVADTERPPTQQTPPEEPAQTEPEKTKTEQTAPDQKKSTQPEQTTIIKQSEKSHEGHDHHGHDHSHDEDISVLDAYDEIVLHDLQAGLHLEFELFGEFSQKTTPSYLGIAFYNHSFSYSDYSTSQVLFSAQSDFKFKSLDLSLALSPFVAFQPSSEINLLGNTFDFGSVYTMISVVGSAYSHLQQVDYSSMLTWYFEHDFNPLGTLKFYDFELHGSATNTLTVDLVNLTYDDRKLMSNFDSNFSLAVSKYKKGHLGTLSFNFNTINADIAVNDKVLINLFKTDRDGFSITKYIELYYYFAPKHLSASIQASLSKDQESSAHAGHSHHHHHSNGGSGSDNKHDHHDHSKDKAKSKKLNWLFTLRVGT